MSRLEIGVLVYSLGNFIILGQNWIGFSRKVKRYRHNGRNAYLLVLALIGSFYLGVAVIVAGLIVLLTVYWWLPILLFLFSYPVFKRFLIQVPKQ